MYSGTFIESAAYEHKLIFVKRSFFSDEALDGHRQYHFPTPITKSSVELLFRRNADRLEPPGKGSANLQWWF